MNEKNLELNLSSSGALFLRFYVYFHLKKIDGDSKVNNFLRPRAGPKNLGSMGKMVKMQYHLWNRQDNEMATLRRW